MPLENNTLPPEDLGTFTYFAFDEATPVPVFTGLGSSGWYLIPSSKKSKPKQKPKTPEERYKEVRKQLQDKLGLRKQSKIIDSILKDYLKIRDEELLRKILNSTTDLRTCHDLRRHIEEYIIINR